MHTCLRKIILLLLTFAMPIMASAQVGSHRNDFSTPLPTKTLETSLCRTTKSQTSATFLPMSYTK